MLTENIDFQRQSISNCASAAAGNRRRSLNEVVRATVISLDNPFASSPDTTNHQNLISDILLRGQNVLEVRLYVIGNELKPHSAIRCRLGLKCITEMGRNVLMRLS